MLWGGSSSRTTGGHLFFVTEYFLHPGYDRATIDLDIGILHVAVSVLFKCEKLSNNLSLHIRPEVLLMAGRMLSRHPFLRFATQTVAMFVRKETQSQSLDGDEWRTEHFQITWEALIRTSWTSIYATHTGISIPYRTPNSAQLSKTVVTRVMEILAAQLFVMESKLASWALDQLCAEMGLCQRYMWESRSRRFATGLIHMFKSNTLVA